MNENRVTANAVKPFPGGCLLHLRPDRRLAGLPGHARQIGYALHALSGRHGVPWQRVINARGEISTRSEPVFEERQRLLLEREGVVFDAKGRVSLTVLSVERRAMLDDLRNGSRPLHSRCCC